MVLVVGNRDLVDGVGDFIVVVVDNSLAEVVFPSVVVVMIVDGVCVVVIVAKPDSRVGLVVANIVVVLDGVVFVVKGGEEDDTVAVVVVIISDASVGTDVVVVCSSVGCVFVDVVVIVYGVVGCVFVDVVVGGGVNISAVVAAPLVVCCEIANSVDVVEDFVVTKEGY